MQGWRFLRVPRRGQSTPGEQRFPASDGMFLVHFPSGVRASSSSALPRKPRWGGRAVGAMLEVCSAVGSFPHPDLGGAEGEQRLWGFFLHISVCRVLAVRHPFAVVKAQRLHSLRPSAGPAAFPNHLPRGLCIWCSDGLLQKLFFCCCYKTKTNPREHWPELGWGLGL